jgi:hypothetical protein
MPVRTTRIDVPALARSAPSTSTARSGGGSGSFGMGLASPFTSYEFEPTNGLQAVQVRDVQVGSFRTLPMNLSTTYELVDDLNGSLTLL